jgi:hypothetical protein
LIMLADEFESAVRAMIANGYSPLPIAPWQPPRPDGRKRPEGKAPGYRSHDGSWDLLTGWQRFCREQPNEYAVAAWLRMIGDAENAGVGLACGRGLICIDIDTDACMNTVMDALPVAVVSKRGKKGVSLFFRGDTDIIRTKHFNAVGGGALVDLLSTGTQSCLPPTRHPDGMFYEWVSEDTLFDTPLDHLSELPNDAIERLAKALAPFGYDPTAERPPSRCAPAEHRAGTAAGASNLWRETNDRALMHLGRWVPALGLFRCRTKPGGYCAVATWRESGTGRPREVRKRNLSIDSRGIADFGDGRTYTPIDLIMAARNLDKFAASNWLLEHLPSERPMIVLRNRKQ